MSTPAGKELFDILEQGSKATQMLKRFQMFTWGDLSSALHGARNGYWSVGVEGSIRRIKWAAEVIDITPAGQIPISLLVNGIYQAVCEALNVECVIDFELDKYRAQYTMPNWQKTIEMIKQMEIELYD